jgi:hypothetical protein
MNTDHIASKIIAITRGIHLRVPPAYERMDVFTVGSHQFSWWLTHHAIAETREVAEMIRRLEPEFAQASSAAIQLEIDRILRATFLDGTLFDLRKTGAGKSSLFDAAVGNAKEFASELLEKILDAIRELQPTWLILYPLRGVVSQSHEVGFDGLSVMAPADADTWQGYASRYPRTTNFNPAEDLPSVFQPQPCGASSHRLPERIGRSHG